MSNLIDFVFAAALHFSFGKTDGLQNVTVQVGSTAYMHCPVIHLGEREVNNLFWGCYKKEDYNLDVAPLISILFGLHSTLRLYWSYKYIPVCIFVNGGKFHINVI